MAASGAAPLKNVYHVREVATPKSCYVCYKETTCCLATVDVSDFIYSCKSHLTDTGFCRPILDPGEVEPTALPTVTQADIDKVKAEYEAKLAAKKEKEGDKDKEKDMKADKPKPAKAVEKPATPPAAPKLPKKVALHRDFFAMRLDAQRTKQAKAVSLPAAPRSLPSLGSTAHAAAP